MPLRGARCHSSSPAPVRRVRASASRFRDLGGKRAVATNVVAELESPVASPEGPDDPCDLKCPLEVARARLARLRGLGFDDVVLVTRRHDAERLQELHELILSSR